MIRAIRFPRVREGRDKALSQVSKFIREYPPNLRHPRSIPRYGKVELLQISIFYFAKCFCEVGDFLLAVVLVYMQAEMTFHRLNAVRTGEDSVSIPSILRGSPGVAALSVCISFSEPF